jgi:hypothetical protein
MKEDFVPLEHVEDLHQGVHNVLASRLTIEWRVREAVANIGRRATSPKLILESEKKKERSGQINDTISTTVYFAGSNILKLTSP